MHAHPPLGGGDFSRTLYRTVLLSALIHAGVFVALFFSPSFPSPRWTFGPVYSVQLVSLPASAVERRSSTSLSREITDAVRREPSFDLKKRPASDAAIPIKRLDTPRVKTQAVDKAVEDVRRRMHAEGKQAPAAAAADQTAGRPSAQEEGGATGAAAHAYYTQLWSRIRGSWALPQGLLPTENLEAVVQVRILRDGTIADVRFERASGNRYFDESALRAIRKAAPFPPLPAVFATSSIDVGIRFRPSDLLG